jgi:hypothetical protein
MGTLEISVKQIVQSPEKIHDILIVPYITGYIVEVIQNKRGCTNSNQIKRLSILTPKILL